MKKKYFLATIILLIVSAFLVNLSYVTALNGQNEGIPGDANGDGEANSLDATLVLKYDAGIIDLDAAQLASSDVNNDGEADSLDATLILKYDAGLIDDFISYETKPSDNEMPDSAFLSSEDIVKLVSMDQTDRKAITSYIQSAALLDDESCREFTDILYSTDIITVDGKLPRSIIYYPETKDLTVIYTVSKSTHWYCFEYILNDETAENRLNTVINAENAVTYSEKLKLLYIPEIKEEEIAKHNSYCWVQINGKLAKGTYCNKNEEITNDVWDSMFSSEVIISPLLKEN